MPTRIAILTPSGLVGADYHADSLREAAGLEPDGVYTVARTYHRNRVVLLDAQLDRLEESARLEGIPFELNRARLRSALAQLIARA